MIRLTLLGGARLVGPDGPLTGPAAQHHRIGLVALLRSAPDGTLPREKLMALLWPEHPEHNAKGLLNLAVHVLRKAVGEDTLVTLGDGVRVDATRLPSDVSEFERALQEQNYRRALQAYGGPFMDGFFLRDAQAFEEWQAAERQRLAREHARALEALAGAAEARGDLSDAVDWWRRLAAAEPLDSRVLLHLMTALEAVGARETALKQAKAHAALLREELDADLPREVQQLAERMRRDPRPVSAPRAPSPPARRAAAWIVTGLTSVAVAAFLLLPRAAPPASGPRIAVLPFADLSERRDQQFLSDGITEELLNALTRVPRLEVVARTSSFQFRDTNMDVREIGRRLGVDLVIEGSVRREGNRIRVAGQLIDASNGHHLWSRVYQREVGDLFTLQEELAVAIAGALRVERSDTSGELQLRGTERSDAYAQYLRGRYEWNRRSENGIWNAIEAFQAAVAADSLFARAYAGLADAYRLLPAYANVSGPDALSKSKAAALRAVALDSNLAEAHTALAASVLEYDHARAQAEREFRRALALNPRDVTALRWYGLHLASNGAYDSALVYVERARTFDPLSQAAIGSVATVHYFARRADDAIRLFQEALQLQPDWATGHAVLGRVYLMAGRVGEAVTALERAVALSGGEANDRALLATAYALAGRGRDARRIATELASRPGRFIPATGLAGLYAALGEDDVAIQWLTRAVELRDTDLKYLKVDPRFDRLRRRPAFSQVLRSVGLS
jgi:TolB-like protein/DNA-binding SARP family transcriptional activator/Tfp pilus assembly protein PilF